MTRPPRVTSAVPPVTKPSDVLNSVEIMEAACAEQVSAKTPSKDLVNLFMIF